MKIGILAAAAAALAIAIPAFAAVNSGLNKGESITPFHPKHVSGPLADSTKCFPCTYQARPQVQVWVNGDDMANVGKIAKALGDAMRRNESKEFKAMVVVLTDGKPSADLEAKLKKIAADNNASNVAMALLNKNDEAVKAYRINTGKDVRNTVIAYKEWRVTANLVNLTADAAGMKKLEGAISATLG